MITLSWGSLNSLNEGHSSSLTSPPVLDGQDVLQLGLTLDHDDVGLGLHTGPGRVLQAEAGADTGRHCPVQGEGGQEGEEREAYPANTDAR